jgi:hypothetical protein
MNQGKAVTITNSNGLFAVSAFPLEKKNPIDDDLPETDSTPILIYPDLEGNRTKFWLNPIR